MFQLNYSVKQQTYFKLTSLSLKGAALFCMGHLIHLLLNAVKELTYYTEDNYDCLRKEEFISTLLHFVYSFLMVYIIFKYSNVKLISLSVLVVAIIIIRITTCLDHYQSEQNNRQICVDALHCLLLVLLVLPYNE